MRKSPDNTTKDYSHTRYLVYFEVMDVDEKVKRIIATYSSETPLQKMFGYEAKVAMQMISEIIREIAAEGIAVYQIVRQGKKHSCYNSACNSPTNLYSRSSPYSKHIWRKPPVLHSAFSTLIFSGTGLQEVP